MRREDGALSVETKNGAVNVWFVRPNTNVVGKVARRKIVGAVHNDVVARDQIFRVRAGEADVMQFDVDVWIGVVQSMFRRFQLASANVFRAVQDLPMQVGKIDIVRIDNSQCADAGRCEVKRGWRSKSSGANAQSARRFQSTLSLDADFRHDEMTRVTSELFGAQLCLRKSLFDVVHTHTILAQILWGTLLASHGKPTASPTISSARQSLAPPASSFGFHQIPIDSDNALVPEAFERFWKDEITRAFALLEPGEAEIDSAIAFLDRHDAIVFDH